MLKSSRQLLNHSSGLVYSQHHAGLKEWAQYTGKTDHPFSGSYVGSIFVSYAIEANTSRMVYSLRLSIPQVKAGLTAQVWTGQDEWFVTTRSFLPSF